MFARTRRLFLRPAWQEDVPALRIALAAAARSITDISDMIHDLADDDVGSRRHGSAASPAPMSVPTPLPASLLVFLRTDAAPLLIGGLVRCGQDRSPDIWLSDRHRSAGYQQEAMAALDAIDLLSAPRGWDQLLA